MSLSNEERARIRDEELIRLATRREVKRKQAPWLMLLVVIWAALLTSLTLLQPLLRRG